MATKKKKCEECTFEEAGERLEEIISALEKGEASLDEMLRLYEEGTALLRRANMLLADAENRILVIGEDKVTEKQEGTDEI